MFRISIACSELALAIRRVGFVTPAGIPAEPRARDRRVREILLANVPIGHFRRSWPIVGWLNVRFRP